jgi:hypothetical protein
MTPLVFWPFLTYLPTLSYSITSPLGGYLGPPLPTLIWDVINERSLSVLDTRSKVTHSIPLTLPQLIEILFEVVFPFFFHEISVVQSYLSDCRQV